MGVTVLPRGQALTPGADLWVVGAPENSVWALKIDWELNFQILRAGQYEPQKKSGELNDVLEKTGLSSPQVVPASQALLIAADLNLPCRWVLSLVSWKFDEINRIWRDLGSPATRLFLPVASSSEDLSKPWNKVEGEFQFVTDQSL